MNFRIYLLFVTIIACFTAHAQDRIYKRDGSVIEAKVKSVGQSAIIYKRFDNPSGPEYTIMVKDVVKIVYENGTTDNFKEGSSSEPARHGRGGSKKKYTGPNPGNNILTIAPLAYTVEMFSNSINDPGVGICYERILDERGRISVVVPVMINFNQNSDFSSSFYNNYGGLGYPGTPGSASNYKSYMFMPGIKFYPADNRSKVRYSLGASFFAMFGNEPYALYDYNNYTGQEGDWHYHMYGLMISNSINVTLSKHLYLEFDINGAIPFSDNRKVDETSIDGLVSPMTQFVLKAGCRF